MMHGMVSDMICAIFEDKVGKWQVRKVREGVDLKALLVSFHERINYDKEEGYRQVDLLVYGPMNYVGVWVRRRWTVISQDDLDYDKESCENVIKEGKDYQTGSTEWEQICYHDSCWRSAINDFLFENRENLTGFDSPTGCPWQVITHSKR